MSWLAVQGVAAIAGMWSSASARSEQNEKRNLKKGIIQSGQPMLEQNYAALVNENQQDRAYYQGLRQSGMNSMIDKGREEMVSMNQQYGQTNLQSGAGQQMQDMYTTNLFDGFNQFNQEQDYAGVTRDRKFAGDARGIAAAGFDIDRYAADANIKSNIGQTLLDKIGGLV